MNSEWLKDCRTDKDKEERKALIRASAQTLKVLKSIVEKQLKATEEDAVKKSNYENASWAYHQADSNGAKRAYQLILSLLDQEEK